MPDLDDQHGTVPVGGRLVPYRIRRSSRARSASIQIHPRRGLEVVLPSRAPHREVHHLLHDRAGWLAQHAGEIQRAAPPPPTLCTGARLPLRGDWRPLIVAPGARTRVEGRDGPILVTTADPGDQGVVRTHLERWYRRVARRVLIDRVEALRLPADGPITRISVRDQSSRWGSCTEGGALSFNWRLVMAPPPVLDPVVAHELLHLQIPEHSRRFWRALDRRFPLHRAARRWLDYNGPRLLL